MCDKDLKTTYRKNIGLFATGVTVLIIEEDDDVHCMTANAVSSVSLEPIQLLVCPSKTAKFSSKVKLGNIFTLNILSSEQEQLSNYFASPDTDKNPNQDKKPYDLLFSEQIKTPRLINCLSSFACKIKQIHDGGDHWIVVGEVLEIYENSDKKLPLLFFAGNYHYPAKEEEKHIEPSADPYK